MGAGVSIAFLAKQTTVTVTDDLEGSANAKEVTFSLDGESWTIDLSAKNPAALEKALKPFVAKGTEKGRPPSSCLSEEVRSSATRTDLAAVRDSSKSNGHRVSDRGRISAAAHRRTTPRH